MHFMHATNTVVGSRLHESWPVLAARYHRSQRNCSYCFPASCGLSIVIDRSTRYCVCSRVVIGCRPGAQISLRLMLTCTAMSTLLLVCTPYQFALRTKYPSMCDRRENWPVPGEECLVYLRSMHQRVGAGLTRSVSKQANEAEPMVQTALQSSYAKLSQAPKKPGGRRNSIAEQNEQPDPSQPQALVFECSCKESS